MRGYQTTKGDGGGIISTEGYCGEFYAKRPVIVFTADGTHQKTFLVSQIVTSSASVTIDSENDYSGSLVLIVEKPITTVESLTFKVNYSVVGFDQSRTLTLQKDVTDSKIEMLTTTGTVVVATQTPGVKQLVEIASDFSAKIFTHKLIKELGKWQLQ